MTNVRWVGTGSLLQNGHGPEPVHYQISVAPHTGRPGRYLLKGLATRLKDVVALGGIIANPAMGASDELTLETGETIPVLIEGTNRDGCISFVVSGQMPQ